MTEIKDYYNKIFSNEIKNTGELESKKEAEKMIKDLKETSEFNKWSLLVVQRYLNGFYKSDFWKQISLEFSRYGHHLSEENISLEICSNYLSGYYFQKQNKIVLCSNMLTNYEDPTLFYQELKRFLIVMYDAQRLTKFDQSDCRFLACSEIRASNLSEKCDNSFSYSYVLTKHKKNRELVERCVKNSALTNLNTYYDHCKVDSLRHVESVFDKCFSDRSPFLNDKLI